MRRTAIDENGLVIDIRDVPQDISERHLHSYTCEGCGERLIPKKGTQQVHHFAHASNVDCDPWSQSMTAWHIAGQDVMATLGARLEVPCDVGNITHRADAVFDRHDTVVELQHSSMSVDTFMERNEFYLSRFDSLVWLFDARGFADRLVVRDVAEGQEETFRGSDDGCWEALANRRTTSGIEMPNPRGWFSLMSSSPCYWTSRGVSVALYVDGPSSFSSGHVVELFPHERPPHAMTCHVWRLGAWLDALSKGNLPFMRRGTVRYVFSDGTIEERTERHGSLVPPPEKGRDIPWYKTRTWRLGGERMEPTSMIVPANGTLEFCEATYGTKAGVAVWLGRRRRGRKGNPPDIDMWLPVNTPMSEVRRMARVAIGEDRADDYDWSGFPEREWLEERVSVTLPVVKGRERSRLTVRDAETGELVGEAWAYADACVSEALDEVRQSLPPSVAGGYDWATRHGSLHMDSPMEVRIHRRAEARTISVTVSDDLGMRLWHGSVPEGMTWDEIREAAISEMESPDRYDWGNPPSPEPSEGGGEKEWVVRGLPRRLRATLDGEVLAEVMVPYGCMASDAMASLLRETDVSDGRLVADALPGGSRILDDADVAMHRNSRATHRVVVKDGMSLVPSREIDVPCWPSLLSDPSDALRDVPPPSPDWAGRFEGLFAVDGSGEPRLIAYPDLGLAASDEELSEVSFLQYGYRHDGSVVFTRGEVEIMEERKARAQMPLF